MVAGAYKPVLMWSEARSVAVTFCQPQRSHAIAPLIMMIPELANVDKPVAKPIRLYCYMSVLCSLILSKIHFTEYFFPGLLLKTLRVWPKTPENTSRKITSPAVTIQCTQIWLPLIPSA